MDVMEKIDKLEEKIERHEEKITALEKNDILVGEQIKNLVKSVDDLVENIKEDRQERKTKSERFKSNLWKIIGYSITTVIAIGGVVATVIFK